MSVRIPPERWQTPDPMPLVHAAGSPAEIGRAHGEERADAIGYLLAEHRTRLAEFVVERTGRDLPADLEARVARRYLPHAEAYSSDLVSEMHGIAQGAGVPFEDIFFLNCFLDIYDAVFPELTDTIIDGCTVFGCTSGYAAGDGGSGGPIVAQNLDLRAFFAPAATLLEIAPTDAPRALVLTVAGVVGCAGMNAAGIALVFNKLAPADSGPGVPFPMLARHALRQDWLGNALHALVGTTRASGSHSMVADCDAGAFGVEASARDYEVTPAQDGLVVHSNHYLTPRLQPLDRHYKRYAGDSFVRLERARRGMGAGGLDVKGVEGVARDHGNRPDAICRHRDLSAPPFRQAATIASIVALPCRREVLIAAGPPCESEFRSYAL